MLIHTPDHRLRVFISSTLKELAEEREAVRQAIVKLRLSPVMFESGARPHPAQQVYKSYLSQSQIFIAIYWQSYGWVAPGMQISGLEDEYNLSEKMPRLIYVKNPAHDRDPTLAGLLERIKNDNTSSYTYFSTPQELNELVQNDLALLLTESFDTINNNEQLPIEARPLPRINIPVPRNALIGREHELHAACNLLSRDDLALITLTGPGGCGKSRLALQIGIEMLNHFDDGVYLVRLEAINDPNLVIPATAEIFGIQETAGSRRIGEMLIEFLHDKHMLLILDNFEHVLGAATEVAELLEGCPDLKAVVTSRAPLRLRAEKELPVPPLAIPSLDNIHELFHLTQYAAVELFIQRSQAVRPDFSVTNDNAAAVAEICFRLDGLPLAIELAASRIKMLSPHELLAKLSNRFDFLRSGTRDLPERQHTLRSAIDWSYNLLNEQEKKLFRRLSIFVGGWTLEAAEAICDLDGDLSEGLYDGIESLIDNNLVVQTWEAKGYSRFGMLTTIHEYAHERLLECDEAEPVQYQHAKYYLGFVKLVEPRIRSAGRIRWHQVLLKEFGNIRSALNWICSTRQCIEIGQQIIITLGTLWVTSGNSAESAQWCAQILSLSDESTPVITRAKLLGVSAWSDWALGEYYSAKKKAGESLALFHLADNMELEDRNIFAMTLVFCGILAYACRDLVTATTMYHRSIELGRELNNQWIETLALSLLGDVALCENDRERALDLHNQSIKLARQQGDPWCLMSPLMSSGQIAILDGNLVKARSIFNEVEDLLRSTGDRWSLSSALNDIGHISLMEGNLGQASKYLIEALNLANTVGNRIILLIILTGIAVILARRSKKIPDIQPQDLEGLSQAGRLCGATEPFIHIPGSFIWSDSKTLYEADITQVKSLLGTSLWKKAYSEGQSMSLNKAITLALQSIKE
jgi:predicted ATPase